MFLRIARSTKIKSHVRKVKRNLTWDEAHKQGLLNAQAKEHIDRYGNTPLHYSLLNLKTISHLKEMILSYGEKEISVMSRTVNNQGLLPYDVVHHNSDLPASEKQEVLSIIKKLMVMHNLKNLSDPVNIDEILKRYYDRESVSLKNNLTFGCQILNEAREIIKDSSTHPQANDYDEGRQNMLRYLICQMRNTYPATQDPKFIPDVTEIVNKTHIGNCLEFGILTLNNAINKNKSAFGSLLGLVNGDHAFSAIDTYQTTACDIKLNTAVIIDGQHGDVFPIDEIPFRLNNYAVRASLRIITALNPHYHYITASVSVNGNISLPDFKKKHAVLKDQIPKNDLVFFKKSTGKNSNAPANDESLAEKPSPLNSKS